MSVDLSDLEARLRGDLPRLAVAILDRPLDSAEVDGPVATELAPARRTSRRAIAVAAGVAAAIVAGAVIFGAGDPVRSHRPGLSAADLGRPVALPTPPLTPRSTPVMVWAGRSLLVWGGSQGDATAPLALRDGAALAGEGPWEPITENSWGHPGGMGTWAGNRLVVLAKNGGATYDALGTKAWAELPRLPDENGGGFRAAATLDNRVYGLVTSVGGTLGIVGLDDARAAWRMFATTTRGEHASAFSLVSDGRGLDLWADGVRVARYDPDRDAWQAGDGITVPTGFGAPRVVGVGGTVAVVDEGGTRAPALLDAAAGSWTNLTGGDITVGAGTTAVSTGDRLIVWGGEQNPGVWAWTLPAG